MAQCGMVTVLLILYRTIGSSLAAVLSARYERFHETHAYRSCMENCFPVLCGVDHIDYLSTDAVSLFEVGQDKETMSDGVDKGGCVESDKKCDIGPCP
jgi:hypothetical protein